jgi:hypothetical protein
MALSAELECAAWSWVCATIRAGARSIDPPTVIAASARRTVPPWRTFREEDI